MRNCPHCSIPLISVEYEGFGVQWCDRCRGHLVASSRLESLKRVARKSHDELKAEATSEFHGCNTAQIKCPRCHMPMRKQAIKLPGLALEFDLCRACSLVWFDGGELALAQLGHEAKVGFADAQEMKRRMEELEASPDRKAEFEKNLARLPNAPDPVEEVLGDVAEEVLAAIIRSCKR